MTYPLCDGKPGKLSQALTPAGFSSIADPLPLLAWIMSWPSGMKACKNFVGSPGILFRQEDFANGTNFH